MDRWSERLLNPYGRLGRLLGRKPPLRTRRFIRSDLSVEDFFQELRDRGVRYAVLRWFEQLPHVDPGEDIDMLFEDADLARVEDLFDRSEGVPCDVYSAGGSPGSTYRGMPYFPPAAARSLLARTTELGGLYRVPCPEDHFLSLAYHAVYQKGLRSGLPTSLPGMTPATDPEHVYARVLADLAQAIGVSVGIDMESLDACLGEHGWHPAPAMLEELAARNAWLAAQSARANSKS
jgi:hypothetical protein